MGKLEYCACCNEPTGRAGRYDDSIYIAAGTPAEIGPICETCRNTIAASVKEITETEAAQEVRGEAGELEQAIIANLAAMLRRMNWHINKLDEQGGGSGLKVLAGKAKELLAQYGLQGNLLRDASPPAPEGKVMVPVDELQALREWIQLAYGDLPRDRAPGPPASILKKLDTWLAAARKSKT